MHDKQVEIQLHWQRYVIRWPDKDMIKKVIDHKPR